MKEVEKKYTHIYSGYIKKELGVCVCTCILNKYLYPVLEHLECNSSYINVLLV